jgi:hypothetical protein
VNSENGEESWTPNCLQQMLGTAKSGLPEAGRHTAAAQPGRPRCGRPWWSGTASRRPTAASARDPAHLPLSSPAAAVTMITYFTERPLFCTTSCMSSAIRLTGVLHQRSTCMNGVHLGDAESLVHRLLPLELEGFIGHLAQHLHTCHMQGMSKTAPRTVSTPAPCNINHRQWHQEHCRITFSRSRSTGVGASGGAVGSTRVMRPLPSISPSTCPRHHDITRCTSPGQLAKPGCTTASQSGKTTDDGRRQDLPACCSARGRRWPRRRRSPPA